MYSADLLQLVKESFYIMTKRIIKLKESETDIIDTISNSLELLRINETNNISNGIVESDFKEALTKISPSALREVVITIYGLIIYY